MTADEVRELFSAAYDGELDAQQKPAFEAALARDAELAGEYAAFRAMLEGARNDPAETPAPDLLPGVQRRLRARSRGRFYSDKFAERAGIGLWNPLLFAVAMVAVVALAWLAYSYLQGIELQHVPR